MTNYNEILSKINKVSPDQIIGIFDYDLTLAEKCKRIFHNAPLTTHQYKGLVRLASQIARFVVLTARGEESTLAYLTEHQNIHGPLQNLTLASNSGHIYREIHPFNMTSRIDIDGYDGDSLVLVTKTIRDIVDEMKIKFPTITADHRELCGAVVYQFEGDNTTSAFKMFHAAAEEVRKRLPETLINKINFVSKHVYKAADEHGPLETQGYIDIKPFGMDKGRTVTKLYQEYAKEMTKEPFVIVAGDSSPDYAMMQALDTIIPKNQRLFLAVGRDLENIDKENKLIDYTFKGNGVSPVQSLHDMLAQIGIPHPEERLTLSDYAPVSHTAIGRVMPRVI